MTSIQSSDAGGSPSTIRSPVTVDDPHPVLAAQLDGRRPTRGDAIGLAQRIRRQQAADEERDARSRRGCGLDRSGPGSAVARPVFGMEGAEDNQLGMHQPSAPSRLTPSATSIARSASQKSTTSLVDDKLRVVSSSIRRIRYTSVWR